MSCAPEIWRDVVGFEGLYEVSTAGRVWSARARRCLKLGPDHSGHLRVNLGRKSPRAVHVLVLETFAGPRPSRRHDGRHLNGRHADNDLLNLAWSSRARNVQDIKWHGGRKGARLTPEMVAEIKELLALGVRQAAIAGAYGVRQTTVSRIKLQAIHSDV